MVRILVVDDEANVREMLRDGLTALGHQVVTADSGMEALRLVDTRRFDVVLLDLRMPGMDGVAVMAELKSRGAEAEVVILTGDADLDSAVTAMRLGARDYLQKPVELPELDRCIRQVAESRRVKEPRAAPRGTPDHPVALASALIGVDPKMVEIRRTIERVGPTGATVLVTGESGTGKEVVARLIHAESLRAGRPMVIVDCPSIPFHLFESELFGHERGAFTGAVTRRRGKAEEADGGTLFLDEVAELPLEAQAKFLRFLQERQVVRVGSNRGVSVDTRVVSTTNANLPGMVKEGTFRQDLFHRLNTIHIELPPLRDRQEDIPLLASHCVERFCQDAGIQSKTISDEALALLRRYTWPGNVRELQNVIQRAFILTREPSITPESLPPRMLSTLPPAGRADPATLRGLERQYILDVLNQEQWNIIRAAGVLGIHRATLYRKITGLGLRPN
jgi:DNA-binding NtrC family response regulator